MMRFAQALRRWRVVAGLSQEALAERAGISVRGLSDLERGLSRAPRLDTLHRLADALGLDVQARQALAVAAGYAAGVEAAPVTASPARAVMLQTLPGFLTGLLGREREAVEVGELGGDGAAAEARYRVSMDLFERLDDVWGRALALRELGSLARSRGDVATALAAYEQSVVLFRQTGDTRGLAQALLGLGRVGLMAGTPVRAEELLREALVRWRDLGLRVGIVRCLDGLAGVAVAQGQAERAARLYAATVEPIQPAALDEAIAEALATPSVLR